MTHEGEFDGIPPTGRKVEVPEMAKYYVVDSEIRVYRVCFDQQAVFEQLGLTEE
jgi:predicted ester cyclase